jgi:2-polyprenyl-3-methyl-5-hydroxy-6-metoxy-1,4-benzoquinol methylase
MALNPPKYQEKLMHKRLKSLNKSIGSSFLHPQWLVNRLHKSSQAAVTNLAGMNILDIGSGDSDLYKTLVSKNQMLRLDYPMTNLRYMRLPDVFADASHMPIANNSIDVVLMFEVLEHVKSPADVCAEIARVLRHQGKLYLSVPFLYPIHDAPHDYQRFTIHGLRYLLSQHNLVVIEEKQHGNSFLVVLQLFNLALLEFVLRLLKISKTLGVLSILIVYPATILANLLAVPFLNLQSLDAACLGYFIVAEKK